MKVTGTSDKVSQFEAQNLDLLFADESKMLIRCIEIDGWIRVMLEIGEKTTNQDIRDTAPMLLKWRDRLLDFQGARADGGDNEFWERLSLMQGSGISYAGIAEMLNQQIEDDIKEYTLYRQEVDKQHPELIEKHNKDIFFSIFWVGMMTKSYSISRAKDLLALLGYKEKDIFLVIKNGLESITEGKSVFSKNYPITKTKVIEALRTWRKGKLHSAISKQKVDLKKSRKAMG